ncbi:MAG: hypothetical protein CLLPBCKN_004712 [Chroococcidiopsis cubana SAG 39.79]|uniref:hypothetical protein n=1 Tax=Chroococcidiopsis cubana TaxID=171392 RepID=UPI002AC596C3|nr:hypothetical protein [Chroococcidiopsis cubana]MDZ4875316.1 hypothetical protein [Chroococcidiopsis cubana SAG 39.79]
MIFITLQFQLGALMMKPPELCRYLYQFTDKQTADLITYYVYNSPHINRLFNEDYVEFINQSPFIVKRLERIGLINIEKVTQERLENFTLAELNLQIMEF